MTAPGAKAGIAGWLEERLGLAAIREFASHKIVPVHSATIWYYFGGITLFLFTIQVLTGVLLLLYYRPSPAEAYESVQFIMTRVEFGWLVRSIHSWSANLMILAAFIHMFSVVFLHAYRKPRELTWLSGIALLGLALAFGFSGYLLPWNKVSYFATKVGTDMAASIPVFGETLARFLRGGDEVGGATLTRFFGFHVAVLPGITTILLVVHLALVQKAGMSTPPWLAPDKVRSMKFFPNFFLRELMAWYAALGVLGSLAALFPWDLGEKADPFASAPVKAEELVLLVSKTPNKQAYPKGRQTLTRTSITTIILREGNGTGGGRIGLTVAGALGRRVHRNGHSHWFRLPKKRHRSRDESPGLGPARTSAVRHYSIRKQHWHKMNSIGVKNACDISRHLRYRNAILLFGPPRARRRRSTGPPMPPEPVPNCRRP